MFRTVAALALVTMLCGCVTRQVGLVYSAPAAATLPASERHPVVAIKTIIDGRSNDAYWLGAIRGGYGNPLKTLKTDQPVKDVVAQAFSDALAARGLLTPTGSETTDLTLTIHRFDCNQFIRREAHADFEITLTDARTGSRVYTDRVTADDVNGSVLAMDVGVFASVDNLRMVAVGTMRGAIDKALDKAAFQAAVAAVPAS